MTNIQSFSIIIEWDNPRLSETDRARLMLRELRHQLIELCLPPERQPEILFLYDPEEVDRGVIEQVIRQVEEEGLKNSATEPTDFWSAKIRIETTPGLLYYEQKNYGVSRTEGELVVFLDSDVIPEANWLKNLLKVFADENIQVVGGNSYLTLDNLYSKAWALFWFFPLRENNQEFKVSKQFFANNLAFRRAVAEKFPFPNLPIFRGQCVVLAMELAKAGIPIYMQNASRVEHPAPNGLNHFINRAFCDGHDDRFMYQSYLNHSSWESTPLGSFYRFALKLARSIRNIIFYHRETKIHPLEIPAAIGLATIFHSLKLGAELIAHIKPQLIRDNFSI